MGLRVPGRVVSWRLVALVFLAAACATVPLTGRQQFRFISNEDLAPTAEETYVRFIRPLQEQRRVLTGNESQDTRRAVEAARRAADRILDAAGLRSGPPWEVALVRSRECNAFVMPNRKIVIIEGLIPVARNEAGLATVIGHEVGHYIAEHRGERLSQAIAAQATMVALDVGLAVAGSPYRPLLVTAVGLTSTYGMLLPFSRLHELEADHIGLVLMAKAGYDPDEALGVWQRMAAATRPGPWEFSSTCA